MTPDDSAVLVPKECAQFVLITLDDLEFHVWYKTNTIYLRDYRPEIWFGEISFHWLPPSTQPINV